jgi:hypothetical protein
MFLAPMSAWLRNFDQQDVQKLADLVESIACRELDEKGEKEEKGEHPG